MIEVLVCNDKSVTAELFKKEGLNMSDNCLAVRAMSGEEMLGFSLLEISGENITVLLINPESDRLLADGILRSTLHVGTERGVTNAFYGEKVSEELLLKINFLEDDSQKRLKLQNLFTDCCNCTAKK